MEVRDLVEKLLTMPQDAKVFVYSEMDEGDDEATDVKVCHIDPEYQWQMKEYYCQGDSQASYYLSETQKKEVVVIGKFY